MPLRFQTVIDSITEEFDVAAGLHEKALNDFSDAHHRAYYSRTQPSVYRGSDSAPDVGIKVWSYDIAKPAVFDLSPFDSKATSKRWLKSIPEIGQYSGQAIRALERALEEEANLKIRIPKADLRIEFDEIGEEPPPPTIELSISLLAEGRITISINNEFQFVPHRIWVDDEASFTAAINAALDKAGLEKGHKIKRHDGDVCYPIEALIRHIINASFRARIEKFTTVLPLPSTLSLFDGVSASNVRTVIIENTLVVFGDAVPSSKRTGSNETNAFNLIARNRDDQNLFLSFSKRLFEMFADQELNIEKSDGESDSSGPAEWAWSYFIRLRNKGIEFRGSRAIRFNIDFDAGGKAKARLRTHCGPLPWIKTSLRADLVPANEYVDAELRFRRRSILLHADTRWSAVGVHPTEPWDILGWVLSIILSLVGTALFSVVDAALKFFDLPLATLPTKFPGTELDFQVDDFRTGFSTNRLHYVAEMEVDFR